MGLNKPAEAIGKTDFDFYPEKFALETYADEQNIMKTGKALIGKIEKIEKDNGQFRWVSATKVPSRDGHGKIIGLVGISRDITEHRKMEEALRENEEKYRAIVESSPNFIGIIQDGILKYVNNAMCEKSGWTFEEMTSPSFNFMEKIVPAKFQTLIKENLAKRLCGEHMPPYEIQVKKRDGSEIPVIILAQRILFHGRPADEILLIDITERKKMEEEMWVKDNAIESSINAVGFADLEGNVTYVNRSFLDMWGYQDSKEILGKPIFSFWKTPKDAMEVVQALVNSGGWIGELLALGKDGSTFDAQLSASVITDDHGKPVCFMASFVDITESKKMIEALKEANSMLEWLLQNLNSANERLEQSNKDLENYTYAVSHDLKAPLRAIRSFSTFLMEDYGDKFDETGQDYLKRISDASSHMGHLIEDLLLLSRVGRKFTKIEKVDLNQLLSEIESDLKPLIETRNAEVVFNALPTISVQRTWMKQILMNLIDNALKFNKSKTPRVEVSYEEREKDHLFKVQDNGIGIKKKYFECIFRLFERLHTEDEYEGTGAGLAICKRIVEHWGGKIWVESMLGKGSTFLFTVPKKGKTKRKKA